jgi:protein tyrosine phosphatase
MSHTAADFWRMVWEQQSRVILMLTEMDERGQVWKTNFGL